MGESSKSKPDEYGPIIEYHYLKFENRCLRAKGDDFQDLFEAIMVKARPGKFERIRPYGKYGDRKCDGLIESEGIIFQVYSPDELRQAEVQKKIDEDLEGAVQHWSDILKKWVFVYNAKRGITADIKLTLQKKRQQYPDIEIGSWSNDYLWELIRGLDVEQRNQILGLPPLPIAERKPVFDPFTERQWQQVCRSMLDRQKKLSTNEVIASEAMQFDLLDDEIFVSLALVERKEPARLSQDIAVLSWVRYSNSN